MRWGFAASAALSIHIYFLSDEHLFCQYDPTYVL